MFIIFYRNSSQMREWSHFQSISQFADIFTSVNSVVVRTFNCSQVRFVQAMSVVHINIIINCPKSYWALRNWLHVSFLNRTEFIAVKSYDNWLNNLLVGLFGWCWNVPFQTKTSLLYLKEQTIRWSTVPLIL